MITTKIVKAARYIPEKTVTNDDLAAIMDTSDEWIYSRTGIKRRHISMGEKTSDLASGAFNKLLDGTSYKPCDIDLIIVTTVTPDYLTPHTACFVQDKVGAVNAFAFDINAACTGFVYAFGVADKMIRSGVYKNIVILSADTLSKIADWSDRATCVLFGDGCGAVLLTASSDGGVLSEDMHSDGSKAMSLYGHDLPVQNAWTPRLEAKQPYVLMNGREIFDFSLREVSKSLSKVLNSTGTSIDDIKFIIPHQANARIIEGVAKKLKATPDKFYVNIHEYGNTSSASIPIALSELMEKGLITPGSGEKIIFAGFGGGLTWGTILFQL